MLVEYILQTGVLVWPLFFCGITATAITIDRLLYFLLSYAPFPSLEKTPHYKKRAPVWEKILGELFGGPERLWQSFLPRYFLQPHFLPKYFLLWKRFRLQNSPYYRIADVYCRYFRSSEKIRNAALERMGSKITAQMENRINGLQIIAAITPIIGLLGTIFGMIEAFQVLEKIEESGGQASIGQLAGGIWTAMLTTALGLSLSLLSHIGYSFLQRILNTRIRQMNNILQYLEEHFPGKSKS